MIGKFEINQKVYIPYGEKIVVGRITALELHGERVKIKAQCQSSMSFYEYADENNRIFATPKAAMEELARIHDVEATQHGCKALEHHRIAMAASSAAACPVFDPENLNENTGSQTG